MGNGSLEDVDSGSGYGLGERARSYEDRGLAESAGSYESKYIDYFMQEIPSNLISVSWSSYHY